MPGLFSSTAITGLIVTIAIVSAILLAGLSSSSRAPAIRSRPLLTPRELEALQSLVQLLPDRHIAPQVSMGALLTVPGSEGLPWLRNRFSQKIIDFVVFDPFTGAVDFLIEIDDSSHSPARDRARDEMTAEAGFITVRHPALRSTGLEGMQQTLAEVPRLERAPSAHDIRPSPFSRLRPRRKIQPGMLVLVGAVLFGFIASAWGGPRLSAFLTGRSTPASATNAPAVPFPKNGTAIWSYRAAADGKALNLEAGKHNSVFQIYFPDGQDHVASIFVEAGQCVAVRLPQASYMVKVTEGEQWLGNARGFGQIRVQNSHLVTTWNAALAVRAIGLTIHNPLAACSPAEA